jgi:hypothetical protein
MVVLNDHLREASVNEVTTIGLDIAKQVFQAHGAENRFCAEEDAATNA